MNCNYLQDNSKEIESKKKDFAYTTLVGAEDIPLFSCQTGTSKYEPTEGERQNYCTADFLHCQRLSLNCIKKDF